MKKFAMPLMALTVVFAVSCNNGPDSTKVADDQNEKKADTSKVAEKMEDDQAFMVDAASGGLMEVQLGQLAATNASSAKVKEFGQKMVADHSKANNELKALALQKNVTIPSTPGEKHQKHIDDLKDKKGVDFDKAYMSMMVDDHEEDIKKFEKEGQDGKDAEVKAFASNTVPVLKMHLEMAKSANDQVKNK